MSWGAAESSVGDMSSYTRTSPRPLATRASRLWRPPATAARPGSWPALSANVVAVGGTTLTINSTTYAYVSETAWSGSNGGQSSYVAEPSYQTSVQSSGSRQTPTSLSTRTPARAWLCTTRTATACGYVSSPWMQVGGTSLATPCIGSLIVIANQLLREPGVEYVGWTPTDLARPLRLAVVRLHDVTSGSNNSHR